MQSVDDSHIQLRKKPPTINDLKSVIRNMTRIVQL